MTSPPLIHVVLHQPEIPHNTGAVGRVCVALGASLWLVRPLGFQLDDRHLRRAGMDYWNHLRWEIADDFGHLCDRLRTEDASRFWLFSKKATRPYTDATFSRQDVLVFGCETQGLPEHWLNDAGERALLIPMAPAARSLNLSTAVAAAGYEARRQILGADRG